MSSPVESQDDVNFEFILPADKKNPKNNYPTEQQSSHYIRNAKSNN